MRAKHYHGDIGQIELDAREAIQPISLWHADIEKYYVRAVLIGEPEARIAVRRFTDHTDIRSLQQGLEARANYLMVVNDE
jgi:hypothetical protein